MKATHKVAALLIFACVVLIATPQFAFSQIWGGSTGGGGGGGIRGNRHTHRLSDYTGPVYTDQDITTVMTGTATDTTCIIENDFGHVWCEGSAQFASATIAGILYATGPIFSTGPVYASIIYSRSNIYASDSIYASDDLYIYGIYATGSAVIQGGVSAATATVHQVLITPLADVGLMWATQSVRAGGSVYTAGNVFSTGSYYSSSGVYVYGDVAASGSAVIQGGVSASTATIHSWLVAASATIGLFQATNTLWSDGASYFGGGYGVGGAGLTISNLGQINTNDYIWTDSYMQATGGYYVGAAGAAGSWDSSGNMIVTGNLQTAGMFHATGDAYFGDALTGLTATFTQGVDFQDSATFGGGFGLTGCTISNIGQLSCDDYLKTASYAQATGGYYVGAGGAAGEWDASGNFDTPGDIDADGHIIATGTIQSYATGSFNTLTAGGGYGATGTLFDADGNGYLNGNLVVDGTISGTLAATPTLQQVTDAGSVTTNSISAASATFGEIHALAAIGASGTITSASQITGASASFTNNVYIGGKLQVNGAIDPTDITYTGVLRGGTAAFNGAAEDANYPVSLLSASGGGGLYAQNSAGAVGVKLYSTVTPGVASATLGSVYFNGFDDSGNPDHEYARINGKIATPIHGTEAGALDFRVLDGGVLHNYFEISGATDTIYAHENFVADKALTAATATVTGSIHAVTDIFATGNIYASGAFYGDGSLLSGVGGSAAGLQTVLNLDHTAVFSTSTAMSLTASDTFNTLDLVHNLGTGQALTVNGYASDSAYASWTVGLYNKINGAGTGAGNGLLDLQSWTGGEIMRIWNHHASSGNPVDIYNSVGSKINSIDRFGGVSVGGDIMNSMLNIHNAAGSGRGDIHIRNSSTSAVGPRITKLDEAFQVGIATGTIITTDKTNAYIYDAGGTIIGGGNTRTYFKNDKMIMSKFAAEPNHPSMLLSWDFADGDASTWTTYFAMDSYNRRVYAQQPFYATAGAYFATNTSTTPTLIGSLPAVTYATNTTSIQAMLQAGTGLISGVGINILAVTFSPAFPTALISVNCSCGVDVAAAPITCSYSATGTTGFTARADTTSGDCEVGWHAVGY